MALPSVSTPKYDLTLPSNGQVIQIRPFLVKEQKLVLQAIEMKDKNQLNNALEDVLTACTFGKLDLDALPVYDVEYLIMQIRARSVGDIVEINYICQNHINDKLLNTEALKYDPNAEPKYGAGVCETKIPVKINLTSLECKSEGDIRPDNRVMFSDTVGVVLRDLPYGVYKKIGQEETNVDTGLIAMAACIESVIDGDQIHNRGDFTDEELTEWLEKLVGDNFDQLDEYMKSMPTMRVQMTLTCPNCGTKEKIKLEGLDDFLV